MLIPKKTKYKYSQRVSYEGLAKGHKKLTKGEFGLQALEGNWINNNQIESSRKAISKFTKKVGKLFINIFPHLPKSKKPLEVRMGSGKGSIDSWVAVVKRGTIMFELKNVPKDLAYKALKAASYKLSVKCKIVSKLDKNEVFEGLGFLSSMEIEKNSISENEKKESTEKKIDISEKKILIFFLKMKKNFLSNPSLIKKLKKDIARNKTLENKKS